MNVKDSKYVIGYTIVVSMIFGVVLSGFSAFTDKRIELNRRAKKEGEILRALQFEVPETATSEEIAKLYDQHIEKKEVAIEGRLDAFNIYMAYEDAETKTGPVGYAFDIGGQGFWAPIYGVMALNQDHETIRGISFYQDDETPGLGHEINQKWFKEQFEGKHYRNEKGEIEILLTTPGTTNGDNEVDAITGASETSRAVQKFLKKNISDFQVAWKKLQEGSA
jgi:Na+-transporting NADH:ubiquinone oxidoreductase subunit C